MFIFWFVIIQNNKRKTKCSLHLRRVFQDVITHREAAIRMSFPDKL